MVAIGQDVYVADMAVGIEGMAGYCVSQPVARTPPAVMLNGLDEPNGLALGPNGTLYIGLLGQVIRFDPGASDSAATMRNVVVNLPDTGRHPLNALAVAPDGSLFVNVASATDHCEQADDAVPGSHGVMPRNHRHQPARRHIACNSGCHPD
ncbi:MAG: glucose dehydrogenase [Rhodospirillales bacterium]|nr:glucose dehydrogenase [Rhodospirillales bacterium]